MLSSSDLPVLDVPERVEALGEDLAQAGRDLSGTADDVHADWAALAGQYVAPEQELVLTAMDTPRQVAGEFLTKMGTASSALSTYAAELRTLRERKRDLQADIARSHQLWATADATSAPAQEWHGNVAVTVDHAKEQAEQEAADFELAVTDRMAQLQADVFTAQHACANAIIGIYGGQPFKMVGQARVDYARLHGMDAETILAGVASEQVGWSQPRAYHHTGTVLGRLPGGAWDSVTGFFAGIGDLAGLNGDGAAAASRSGLAQFGGDLWNYDVLQGMLGGSDRSAEANQRIHGMASGGWNSFINDPGHFLGGLAPDIALGAVTAGAGTAATRGVRTGLRAADGGPLATTLRNLGVPTIRYQPHYAYAGTPGNPSSIGGRFITGNTTIGDLLDQLALQSRADRGDGGSGGGSTSGQDSPGARAGSPDNQGGAGPGLPRDPDGLGDWGPVTESMSARAEVYQEQITGQPVNIGYVVDGTKFDGYANGEFIDAKGPGYNSFFRADGTPHAWWEKTGGAEMIDQAERQLTAARGNPVVWYVAEPDAARNIERWLIENDLLGVEIRTEPPREE